MVETMAAVSAFSGNENKALLWSALHGGGKFVGIPDSQVHVIKEIFEQTIHDMNEHCRRLNQPLNLNAINKEAVVIICKKIEVVKQQQQQQSLHNPKQIYQKKNQEVPQLETIYRAEDLKKERESAFQNEFKKKEKEMSSILNLKKPEEINFTDDIYDKPIGNDMERLLAEALASRERELEQIKNVVLPPPQLSSAMSPQLESKGSDSKQDFINYKIVRERDSEKNIKENEKRVSFENEIHIIENQKNKNENEDGAIGGNDNENDVNFIFNKLKKIKKNRDYETQVQYEYPAENNVNENNNSHTILKILQDVEHIKSTLAELMEKINKLCSNVN
jgi:hypothetical protein